MKPNEIASSPSIAIIGRFQPQPLFAPALALRGARLSSAPASQWDDSESLELLWRHSAGLSRPRSPRPPKTHQPATWQTSLQAASAFLAPRKVNPVNLYYANRQAPRFRCRNQNNILRQTDGWVSVQTALDQLRHVIATASGGCSVRPLPGLSFWRCGDFLVRTNIISRIPYGGPIRGMSPVKTVKQTI
jgi:hypothetical protein